MKNFEQLIPFYQHTRTAHHSKLLIHCHSTSFDCRESCLGWRYAEEFHWSGTQLQNYSSSCKQLMRGLINLIIRVRDRERERETDGQPGGKCKVHRLRCIFAQIHPLMQGFGESKNYFPGQLNLKNSQRIICLKSLTYSS